MRTIDITPEALKTPEGAAKVAAALNDWHDAQASVANLSTQFFKDFPEVFQLCCSSEDAAEIRAAIRRMEKTQDAFLRALAGRS